MTEIKVDETTDAFLSTQINLVLATTRGGRSPQISPVWFLWKDQRFVISTTKDTAKWKNLKRNPHCSICVDNPVSGQMVVAYGVSELQEADVWDKTWELVAKYLAPQEVQTHMDQIFDGQSRVLVLVKPEKIFTRAPVGFDYAPGQSD